jgi:hypothetical protein
MNLEAELANFNLTQHCSYLPYYPFNFSLKLNLNYGC